MLKQGHTEPRLPVWMTAENKIGAVGAGGKKLHFIRNTMEHIAEIFLSELYSEKYAGKPMLLQLVDARIKVITFLAFLIFGGFAHSLLILTVLAVIPVFYAAQSGVKACVFLRRIWLTVPLLVLLFSLPGGHKPFCAWETAFLAGRARCSRHEKWTLFFVERNSDSISSDLANRPVAVIRVFAVTDHTLAKYSRSPGGVSSAEIFPFGL